MKLFFWGDDKKHYNQTIYWWNTNCYVFKFYVLYALLNYIFNTFL